MQIVTEGNDLEGIEPSKSFRNAEDSVPYGTPEESDKLQFGAGDTIYNIYWQERTKNEERH